MKLPYKTSYTKLTSARRIIGELTVDIQSKQGLFKSTLAKHK